MIVKWFASAYEPSIERRLVDSESENYVTWEDPYFARLRKYAKETAQGTWFDTWEEARDWQVARYEVQVECAKNKLNRMRSSLGEAQALKKPEEV